MLNISNRISLSNHTRRKIKELFLKEAKSFNQGSWKKISKTVKNEISKKLLAAHGLKCVYCERNLWALTPEIDHFAHKALYPQFTFNPTNLFYACGHCNSSGMKGSKPTIQSLHKNYNQCQFKIVHPFYHHVDNEIVFREADRIYLDLPNCSQLGLETVTFFKLDGVMMTFIRSKTLILERDIVLTSDEQRELLNSIIAYK